MRKQPSNFYAPDGYRYGVRFRDGAVADWWNGRTQRKRAFEAHDRWHHQARTGRFAANYLGAGEYTVVRRPPDGPWEPVCAYADPGEARCPEAICDCFIATHPEDPFGLHPEDFTVTWPQEET